MFSSIYEGINRCTPECKKMLSTSSSKPAFYCRWRQQQSFGRGAGWGDFRESVQILVERMERSGEKLLWRGDLITPKPPLKFLGKTSQRCLGAADKRTRLKGIVGDSQEEEEHGRARGQEPDNNLSCWQRETSNSQLLMMHFFFLLTRCRL
jgi:hypothetical protein